jgi:hypothetical protein
MTNEKDEPINICNKCGRGYSDTEWSVRVLKIIRECNFNNFNGEEIYKLLIQYQKFWSKIEVPKDYDLANDGTDTIFIYPKDNKTTDCTFLLGKALGGNECSWRESNQYVRVWWD